MYKKVVFTYDIYEKEGNEIIRGENCKAIKMLEENAEKLIDGDKALLDTAESIIRLSEELNGHSYVEHSIKDIEISK